MFKRKYREYILVAGIIVIVATFIKFVNPNAPEIVPPGYSPWTQEAQRNLGIWLVILLVVVAFMVLIAYLTRTKK